ncbi:hypothetical protein GCM10009715_40010 [Paeniglutamicibacter psychrophenolicus]
MPYVVLAFFACSGWDLTTRPDTGAALVHFTPMRFLAMCLGYRMLRRNQQHAAVGAPHDAEVARERAERRARLHTQLPRARAGRRWQPLPLHQFRQIGWVPLRSVGFGAQGATCSKENFSP